MRRLAIVGGGIAGLGAAYYLRDRYCITLFDKGAHIGGHTNTVDVERGSSKATFDTGFMVYNLITYPCLKALFDELDVPVKPTDMSFSVQHCEDSVEWNGAGLSKIFAQRRNLISPRFWRMLLKLDWFNKNAPTHLNDPATAILSVQDYIARHDLGKDFLNWYMVPMAGAVWSTPPEKMLDFPIFTLIRFFQNHGFLGLDTHFQWYTVDGGAKNYVERLLAKLKPEDRVFRDSAVKAVSMGETPKVVTETGTYEFDRVILACHADQALALLTNPTKLERELLSPFHYQDNHVLVHTDESVMPKSKLAWASWNYRVEGGLSTTHYWMNSLQGLPGDRNYFVSLNSANLVDEKKVLREIKYEHPLFDLNTFEAQKRLSELNRQPGSRLGFCGSYFRYGFHEDALKSSYDLVTQLSEQDAAVLRK